MILGLVVALAVALRVAQRGSIRDLGELHLRGESFLLFALVLVVALPAVAVAFKAPRSVTTPTWLGFMVLLLTLCLLNTSVSRGFSIMACGVALNAAVIAANGGMPVSDMAAMSVGGATGAVMARAGDAFHVAATASTRLLLLGDVLPLPGPPGLRAVLSVGDVLMFIGIAVILISSSPEGARVRSVGTPRGGTGQHRTR